MITGSNSAGDHGKNERSLQGDLPQAHNLPSTVEHSGPAEVIQYILDSVKARLDADLNKNRHHEQRQQQLAVTWDEVISSFSEVYETVPDIIRVALAERIIRILHEYVQNHSEASKEDRVEERNKLYDRVAQVLTERAVDDFNQTEQKEIIMHPFEFWSSLHAVMPLATGYDPVQEARNTAQFYSNFMALFAAKVIRLAGQKMQMANMNDFAKSLTSSLRGRISFADTKALVKHLVEANSKKHPYIHGSRYILNIHDYKHDLLDVLGNFVSSDGQGILLRPPSPPEQK